jgi:glycosyltransferase involved in cell wall biosynthesis
MPKILYLADSLEMGGLERQLTLLVKYLPAPWEAYVASLGGGMFTPKILELGVPLSIFERRFRYDLTPVLQLCKLIYTLRPDVVHSWGALSSAVAGPICKMLSIKFIDGSIRQGSAPTRNVLRARAAFFLADRIIANSYAGLHACKISPSKGKVIYNAIDPQRLQQVYAGRRNQIIGTIVIMAARMVAEKDFMIFIEGAREISRIDASNWLFIALGDGADRTKLIEQSSDLISEGVLEFPEPVDDIVPYILRADIGVLLTKKDVQEGLSNTIMEYMACGLPVMCNTSGGNSELVMPGETGIFIQSGSVSDFVKNLIWFKDHTEQAKKMGKAGKERINQLCSVDRMVSDYIGVYQDILDFKKGDHSQV